MSSPASRRHHQRIPQWQRWLGLSEVWIRGELSSKVLLWLRWLAVTGQTVTLLTVWLMGVHIPWLPCMITIGVAAMSNLLLYWWLRQVAGQLREGFFHVLLWDGVMLTLLLHWTGGLANPFSLFYLIQLTLAAVALRGSAVIGLALIMGAGCLFLWMDAAPLEMRDGSAIGEPIFALGRMVALLLAGLFILTLLLALRRRSHQLQMDRNNLRAELESRDRFLSVAALATGFAHELATPLATIVLAAEECETQPSRDSAALISREALRCQGVLTKLRTLGEEAHGLLAKPRTIADVVQEALRELVPAQRERVQLKVAAGDVPVTCAGLREALLVLLRNALLSSPGELPVYLRTEERKGNAAFIVEDRGPGFSPELLLHWGEPFRSTREPGAGMGLGLFFVRRLMAAMQGQVEVTNLPGGGARVSLTLPICRRHP